MNYSKTDFYSTPTREGAECFSLNQCHRHTKTHHWHQTSKSNVSFLGALDDLLDDQLSFFIPSSQQKLSRMALDGVWLIKASIDDLPVAILWSDFRVKGGSVSKKMSTDIVAFIDEIDLLSLPMIMGLKTMGVRFMEGRTVFEPAFSILPAIDRFRRNNFLLTLTQGNVLGIGALLFGMGHYRIALAEDTCLNLTGPEVCKMVFGQQVKFEDISSTRNQFKNTDLIHEMTENLSDAFQKIRQLLDAFFFDKKVNRQTIANGVRENYAVELESIKNDEAEKNKGENNIKSMLSDVADTSIELFKAFDDRMHVFVATLNGRQFGILMSPPGNSNNMIRVRTLTLFEEALCVFEQLKLPVLSLLDTPGADPRMDGSNRLIVQKLLSVSEKIISYPYKKLGVVTGRAYGGACILGFPKIFGSEANFALEGASIGVMHNSIIDQLLSSSMKLKKQWGEVEQTQTNDLKDVIDNGSINGVIKKSEIKNTLYTYLLDTKQQATRKEIHVTQGEHSNKGLSVDLPVASSVNAMDETKIINVAGRYLPTIRHHRPHGKQGDHQN